MYCQKNKATNQAIKQSIDRVNKSTKSMINKVNYLRLFNTNLVNMFSKRLQDRALHTFWNQTEQIIVNPANLGAKSHHRQTN